MAATYTTPGVYLEEIPKFPPSIAPVATAIPVFIGYTEKAIETVAGDLHNKTKRITSLVEYENFFGLPQKEEKIKVDDRQRDGCGRQRHGDQGHGDARDRGSFAAHHVLRAADVLRQRRRPVLGWSRWATTRP